MSRTGRLRPNQGFRESRVQTGATPMHDRPVPERNMTRGSPDFTSSQGSRRRQAAGVLSPGHRCVSQRMPLGRRESVRKSSRKPAHA
uniref:Uncharacterized protein n=1 Tax=Ralstonia syzygii R24 TaxID=907261 RepID=G3A522_9RALS|nr:hypothetical protein RALSY_30801 [Ralstonia syzygii R24]